MMNFPNSAYPDLPPNTIVPDPVDQKSIFIQYFNRLYEDIAFAVNQRDFNYYEIEITSTLQNILFLPTFGAFIVAVSGVDSTQPVKTWSLVKSNAGVAGVINILGTQAGTDAWAGINLTITSTATNFQIAHNRANVAANFNIRIIGTQ